MPERVVIHWFRNDLRLADNAGLTAAASAGDAVVPLFTLDEDAEGVERPGGASRWWLHGSLASLDASLRTKGSRLVLRRGHPVAAVMDIAAEAGVCAIHFTRGYEPRQKGLERELRDACSAAGIEVRRFAGAALFEPEAIHSKTGEPYRVFTPFWKACLERSAPALPLPAPASIAAPRSWPKSDKLADWELLPTKPDWAVGLREAWQPGEAHAMERLHRFLSRAVAGYPDDRNRPDLVGTSMLSPHLHFGEIGPRQCWHTARARADDEPKFQAGIASFLREIGWREFCLHLLHHWPHVLDRAFRDEFSGFSWAAEGEARNAALEAWQKGKTGYPIVDAGMRQLWHTGWMHNRVRMIVASFLSKHLLIPWQEGAGWFLDTLVDADLANNQSGWQWVAGSGADAAPYFRVFNPVLQGAKFDPDGAYVRRWVPELARLPAAHIHTPWLAPREVLAAAGIALGTSYPLPMIDHAEGRARALAAYAKLNGRAQKVEEPAGRKRPASKSKLSGSQ